jgi:hypothetical protein
MRLREFSSEVNMIPFICECGEESCILLKLATRQDCFSILVYVMLFITILFQQLDQMVSTRCFNADPSFHLLRAVDCYCLCFACRLATGRKNGEEQEPAACCRACCPVLRHGDWGAWSARRRMSELQNPTDRHWSLYRGGGLSFSIKSQVGPRPTR